MPPQGPPPGIDMSVIRDAMARRGMGSPVPAAAQMSQPGGALPTGGPNTPIPMPPQPGMAQTSPHSVGAQAGPANPAAGAIKTASLADSPQFDPDTRLTAKALIAKLLKVM